MALISNWHWRAAAEGRQPRCPAGPSLPDVPPALTFGPLGAEARVSPRATFLVSLGHPEFYVIETHSMKTKISPSFLSFLPPPPQTK